MLNTVNPTPTNVVVKKTPRKFHFNFDSDGDDEDDDSSSSSELKQLDASSSAIIGLQKKLSNRQQTSTLESKDEVLWDRRQNQATLEMIRSLEVQVIRPIEDDKLITESNFPIKTSPGVSPHVSPHPPLSTPKGSPTNFKPRPIDVDSSISYDVPEIIKQKHKIEPENSTFNRTTSKNHFNICFRWPSKVFATVITLSIFILFLLRESYTLMENLSKIVIEIDTSNVAVDVIKTTFMYTTGNPNNRYLTASAFNSSTLLFLCECTSVNSEHHCTKHCVQQWSQPASTSISFNTSSFGYGVTNLEHQKDVNYIVWNETRQWINDWQFILNVWTVVFSIILLLVSLWFMFKVVRGRKIVTKDTMDVNYYNGKLVVERPVSS